MLAHSSPSIARYANVTGPSRALRHHHLSQLVGFIDGLGPIHQLFIWPHPWVSSTRYNIVTDPIRVPRHNIPFEPVGSIDTFG